MLGEGWEDSAAATAGAGDWTLGRGVAGILGARFLGDMAAAEAAAPAAAAAATRGLLTREAGLAVGEEGRRAGLGLARAFLRRLLMAWQSSASQGG